MFPTFYDPDITYPGYVTYDAPGGVDTFDVPFDYAMKASITDADVSKFIITRLREFSEDYTLQTDGTEVVLDSVPNLDDEVEIFRDSDIEELRSFNEAGSPVTQENLRDYEKQMQDLGAENLQRVRWLNDEYENSTTELQSILDAAALLIAYSVRLDQLREDTDALAAEIDVSGPTDGQALIRLGTSWQNKTLSNVLLDAAGVLSIDAGVVLAGMIQDNSVTTTIITNANVTVAKYADGVLVNNPLIYIRDNIPDVVISYPQVAGDVLVYDTGDWVNVQISGDIEYLNVSGVSALTDDTVATAILQDDSISEDKLATGAVSGDMIEDAAITAGKLGVAAFGTGQFVDGTLTFLDLSGLGFGGANSAISEGKIVDGAITGEKFQAGSIIDTKFDDLAVTTGKLKTDMLDGVRTMNLHNEVLDSMDYKFSVNLDFGVGEGAIFGRFLTDATPERSRFHTYQGQVNYAITDAGVWTFDPDSVAESNLDFTPIERLSGGKAILGGIGAEADDLGDSVIGRAANSGVSQLDEAQHTTNVGMRRTLDASYQIARQIYPADGETWTFRITIVGRDAGGADYYANAYNGWISRDGTSTIGVSEDADYPKEEPVGWTYPIIDIASEGLRVRVGGKASTTITWTAVIKMTKVHQ